MTFTRRNLANTHIKSAPLSRRGFISCTAVLAAVTVTAPAKALQIQTYTAEEAMNGTLQMPGKITPRKGVTPWATLEQVNFNGFTKPATLAKEIVALEGQTVRVEGYVMAFEDSETSRDFIVSAYSTHCPFCSPGSMASMVTVQTATPVSLTRTTLTLEGKLQIDHTATNGMIYYLTDAKPV